MLKAKAPGDLETVQERHHVIQHDDVERTVLRGLKARRAIVANGDVVAFLLQVASNIVGEILSSSITRIRIHIAAY